jgi:thiamine biosynthesis lipoprotein ApbE/Mn2+/Fe2+ NRAMP family transporter
MDEKQYLQDLSSKPFGQRLKGYMRLTGPGYMQSAMTLGGGSIASCVLMGSILGYELLWVQPVAIFLGVCVLGAVAKQTTTTGEEPYGVFWRRLHPLMAILWAVSSLIATLLWHIPQYGLTANGAVVLGDAVGLNLNTLGGTISVAGVEVSWGRILLGALIVPAAGFVLYLYNQGARGLKIYERIIKVLVWLIVLAFTVAAFSSGLDFGRFFSGITGVSFIQRIIAEGGVPPTAIGPMVGALAAAVGINMIFLYPYSLLNKNWGKEHKELAYFDLVSGMAVPFMFATAFMMMAVANTIGPDSSELGVGVKDMREIIPVLDETLGATLAHLVIGLGMFAVGFSTIVTHMLASGFIGCELFGMPYRGKAKLWFSLLPVVGVVGVAIQFPFYAAVTASLLAAPLMPITVVGFLLLMNNRDYLGDETPKGGKKLFWNFVLLASALTLSAGAYFSLKPKYDAIMEQWRNEETAARPQAHAAAKDLPDLFTLEHNAMGTRFEFQFADAPDRIDPAAIQVAAQESFEAVDILEKRISSWDPESETSRLNRTAHRGPTRVSTTLLGLLLQSEQLSRDTQGAFDVSVGPLVDLYRASENAPAPEALQAARDKVGMEMVALDIDKSTVAFEQEGMRLDFGGIGKGLALDNAENILRDAGVENALLSGGHSTLIAMGSRTGTDGWRVEILNPLQEGNEEILVAIRLKDAALSTSSIYRTLGEDRGKKNRHIFDPRSGKQVDTLVSATVIAPTAAVSDALSTAFYVLGVEETRAYCADHPDVHALFVVEENGVPSPVRINWTDDLEAA